MRAKKGSGVASGGGREGGREGGKGKGEKGRERRSGHDLRRPRHSQRVPTSHIISSHHHQRQGGPAHRHHHPPSRLALPLPTTAWPPDLVPIGGGTRPNSSEGYDCQVRGDLRRQQGHTLQGASSSWTPWPGAARLVAGVFCGLSRSGSSGSVCGG